MSNGDTTFVDSAGAAHYVYTIPLIPAAQQFTISLAGETYGVKLQWCAPAACWTVEISDANGDLLVGGVPLVTGADLLEQFGYLGIGGSLLVQSTNDPDEVPSYASLGTTGNVFFATPPLSS